MQAIAVGIQRSVMRACRRWLWVQALVAVQAGLGVVGVPPQRSLQGFLPGFAATYCSNPLEPVFHRARSITCQPCSHQRVHTGGAFRGFRMTIAPEPNVAEKVSGSPLPAPAPAPALQGRTKGRIGSVLFQKSTDFPGLQESCEALHVRVKTGIEDEWRQPGVQVGSDVWVNAKSQLGIVRSSGTDEERSVGTLGRRPIPLSPQAKGTGGRAGADEAVSAPPYPRP